MIAFIVDGSGAQMYRGHETNEKVDRLVTAGNTRVDEAPPDEWATWDAASGEWLEGRAPAPKTLPSLPDSGSDRNTIAALREDLNLVKQLLRDRGMAR